ncbi:MAG: hypothetical protein H7Y86_00735 [Rhizobacter sp.]|nr:hypothetical protein [Ferruginibacter sp.]
MKTHFPAVLRLGERNSTKLFFYFSLLLLSFSQGFAQSPERIYLHTDKDFYLPGETVWFKSYLFHNNQPSPLSTNLYLQVYDEQGVLLTQKQYPILDGTSNGEFIIPDTIASPLLQFRLFTKNMVAADSNLAYIKKIPVYQKGVNQAAIEHDKTFSVTTHPEGGVIIAGLNNYIAFKSGYKNGQPAITKAVVTDGNATFLDSLISNEEGISLLQFIPRPGKDYTILFTDNFGSKTMVKLDSGKLNSATLHTELSNNKLYYNINKNSLGPELNQLHLSVLSEGEILFKQSISINNKLQFTSHIDTDSLPPGIFDLVLEDANNKLLQSKKIYVKSRRALPLVNVIEKSALPKGKNVLEILFNDSNTNYLSASVVDEIFYPAAFSSSIKDGLLLNEPGSILQRLENDNKATALYLMTWKPGKQPVAAKIVADNFLSVQVGFKEKKNNTSSNLVIIVKDSYGGQNFYTLPENKQQSFLNEGLIFYDSAKIYYNISGNKELSEKLVLAAPASISFPKTIPPAIVNYSFQQGNDLENADSILTGYQVGNRLRFNEIQDMKTIVIKSKYRNPVTKRLEELDNIYTTGLAKGLARGTQLNVLDDPNAQFSDPFNYILFRTSSTKILGTFGSRSIISTRPNGGGELLVFIDDNPADFQQLESIQMSQVAYIKIILGIVITGSGTTDAGVIYLYRKKGNEDKSITGMRFGTIKGYDIAKEFVIPDYSGPNTVTSKDYRTTLYWNPYLVTNKENRKIRIEYYNNDLKSKQILIIKGFNQQGELVEFKYPLR